MAIRLLRAALVCCALLFLGSCSVFQFLLGSVFPSTVTLLKAQVDLSASITTNDSSSYSIRVFTSAGKQYVALSGTAGVNGNAVMFFDADLNAVTSATTLFTDHYGVFADSTGQVIWGSRLFSPGLSTNNAMSTASVFASNGVGVDGFLAATVPQTLVFIPSQGTSSSFTYQTFTDPLTATSTPLGPVSVPLSTASSNLEVRAVLDDGNPSGNALIVIVAPNSGNSNSSNPGTSYFLTIPKTSFVAPTGTVGANLVDTAPHRDGLDPDSFGYADGHLIAYDTTIASYVLIDPANAATVGSFYSHVDPAQVRFAYPPSGGFYYTYDTQSRALSKYAKWW